MALDDFGVAALVNGSTMPVISCLEASRLDGDMINQAGPYVLASTVDVASRAVVVGSVMTINGTNYNVLVIDPDGPGMVLLGLEVAP